MVCHLLGNDSFQQNRAEITLKYNFYLENNGRTMLARTAYYAFQPYL
jgi:hypothetical protein